MNLIKKAFDFQGKSTRKSFWLFITLTHLAALLLCIPMYKSLVNLYALVLSDPAIEQTWDKTCTLVSDRLEGVVDTSDYIAKTQWEHQISQNIQELNNHLEDEAELTGINFNTSIINFCISLVVFVLYCKVMFFPWISFIIRRLRDAGFHPAWAFLLLGNLVPMPLGQSYIFSLALLILLLFPSKSDKVIATDKEK